MATATLLQKLQALATKRQFVAHQSIGGYLFYGQHGDLTAGMAALLNNNPTSGLHVVSNPSNISQVPVGSWAEFEFVSGNGDPIAKINEFDSLVRTTFSGQLDYAAMKFCFADFNDSSNIDTAWARYQEVMDALEVTYPGRIIYWTVPLLPWVDGSIGNVKREEMSNHIRQKYGPTGRVFDFADWEKHDSTGALITRDDPQSTQVREAIPAMAYEYCLDWTGSGTASDGHPNDASSSAWALRYVDFMYALVTSQTMTTAHRSTGMAPLAVFCDAVATTNTGVDAPFVWAPGVTQPSHIEGSHFVWDFGDTYAGTWSSGKSKNVATGFTAAHVYDRPGTYLVTLTVTDTAGVTNTYQQRVVVTSADGVLSARTFYVAANGSDTNAGTFEAPFLSVARAIQEVDATTDTGARILFRKGDTFNSGTTLFVVRAPGPGLIGSYADGTAGHTVSDARPILASTSTVDERFLQVSDGQGDNSPSGTGGTDWRILDLEFSGGGGSSYAIGRPATRPTKNLLVKGCYLHGQGSEAINWQPWGEHAMLVPDEGMFIVENEVANTGMIGMYGGGHWLAYLGNYIHNTGNHCLRIWQGHKACLAHNRIWNQGSQRHNLKLHAPSYAGDSSVPYMTSQPDTRWVSLTDNHFRSSFFDSRLNTDVGVWSVSLGPQNDWNDERVSHILYERNYHDGSGSSIVRNLESSARYAVYRNNVFTAVPTFDDYAAIHYVWRGQGSPTGAPQPTDVLIYNNTVYCGSAVQSGAAGFSISSAVLNCSVRNNLVVLTGGGTTFGVFMDGAAGGGTGWVQDHNVLVTNASTPVFTSTTTPDFSLVSGSPAVDAGATLPEVREDFVRAVRLAGYEVGAYNFDSGAPAPISLVAVAFDTSPLGYRPLSSLGTRAVRVDASPVLYAPAALVSSGNAVSFAVPFNSAPTLYLPITAVRTSAGWLDAAAVLRSSLLALSTRAIPLQGAAGLAAPSHRVHGAPVPVTFTVLGQPVVVRVFFGGQWTALTARQ